MLHRLLGGDGAIKTVNELHIVIFNRLLVCLFICGFYVAFNTVQVISRRVVGRAEETRT